MVMKELNEQIFSDGRVGKNISHKNTFLFKSWGEWHRSDISLNGVPGLKEINAQSLI